MIGRKKPIYNVTELTAFISYARERDLRIAISNNPKGRVPRALPVGEWELAHRASSIACVLERVPRALPVGIYF